MSMKQDAAMSINDTKTDWGQYPTVTRAQLILGLCQSFQPLLNCQFNFLFRHKTMWGWGGDKTEVVNGFECKVYTATGVEVLTKTRVEHLNAEDKQAAQSEF